MLSYTSPHGERGAPEKYLQQYENKFPETPYTGMSTDTLGDKYAWYYPTPAEKPHATLAATVTALDDYVGQIEQTLKDKDIYDNTIIMFTPDNRRHDKSGGDPRFFNAFNASAPYKEIKRDVYNGGIHVPMIVTGPKINSARVNETPWAFAVCRRAIVLC